LKYVDELKQQIPREEITRVEAYLSEKLLKIDPHLTGIVCGSYRRGNEKSGDVDYIVTHSKVITQKDAKHINYITELVTALMKDNFITDSLTGINVQTKYMGIYQLNGLHRRIDIRFIPLESYYTALMYFTGPKDFNRKTRLLAINMDYMLNEYGLYDEHDKMMKIDSEKDIFDALGLEYLTPDKRS